MMSLRGSLFRAGRAGKLGLGGVMLAIAIATISGGDRQSGS